MGQTSLLNGENETMDNLFADIILPIPIPKLFTYRIPREFQQIAQPGHRAIVQFGTKKILTGVISSIHSHPPKAYTPRYLHEILDEEPMVNQYQLKLFHWMADYYMCNVGEVLNIALPSGLKLNSESLIEINPIFNLQSSQYEFTAKEMEILKALEGGKTMTFTDVMKLLDQKTVHHILKSLIQKDAIIIFEQVKEKFKPKIVKKIKLTHTYAQDPSCLEPLFKETEKFPKQTDIILRYLQMVPVFKTPGSNTLGIEKSELLKHNDLSSSALNTLLKKEILEEFEEVVSRFNLGNMPDAKEISLTPAQTQARDQIIKLYEEKKTVLFHGITGSGKTEIYIDLIQKNLESGCQVLYLVPEIALTTQIVSRLKHYFGDCMGVYHSKFSDNERVEIWKGVLSGKYSFVVGVRSSILLPFDNLGLIIVDEEHETSYKQMEPAPRYHARDLALVVAQLHHSKTLLGSATPSVESYYNAQTGKYGLVTLKQRYADAALPEIHLADLRQARKTKAMQADFSQELIDEMEQNLKKNEQTIIFQNRRGYAPHIACEDCAYIPKCQACSVSLTYHLYSDELRCHYCGYKTPVPKSCPACGSHKIKNVGFGTEKLEDDIKLFLPQARVQRMDLDTTRKKHSYQQIIDAFENEEIDILVGTQMVSKGLDFDNVSLVGVLDIDRMIHFPDFRSFERTFQMATQVSGRAGRKDKKGRVIIQTANIQQPLLHKIIANDYESLYLEEIKERERFKYPPFYRLIKIITRHPDKAVCHKAADVLALQLTRKLGKERVLGPQEPMISKLRNYFLMEILIKIEKGINLNTVKDVLKNEIDKVVTSKDFKRLSIIPDVDPY
jgi:primosomal protein N' (replication factor Y) (superfamily II helicase)